MTHDAGAQVRRQHQVPVPARTGVVIDSVVDAAIIRSLSAAAAEGLATRCHGSSVGEAGLLKRQDVMWLPGGLGLWIVQS